MAAGEIGASWFSRRCAASSGDAASRLLTMRGWQGRAGGGTLMVLNSPPLAHVDVDIEIDVTDALLRCLVRTALVPAPLARMGITHIGEPQTAPLRQLPGTLAGKLP